MSKKPVKRQLISQEELDVYQPLAMTPGETVPDHIAMPESQAIAVEDEISRYAENKRWNAALGKPLNEELAFIQKALPLVARGLAHDEGSRKERGSRWPSLDAWIEAKLRQQPFTNEQLFNLAPEVGDDDCRDFYRDGVYRDGGVIVSETKKKPLGPSGFDKRVTEARERIANPVSH